MSSSASSSHNPLTSKKVFIVLCHPEKNSLNHTLAKQIRESLESQGAIVQVSDLHDMKWNPVSDRSNFKSVANDKYYQQAQEERKAYTDKTFSDEITHEMEKIKWCDTLIFQTPLHWYGLPAMIKSWCDKVFSTPFAYGNGRWYDLGPFRGKRAFLSVTTGANEKMYRETGIQGDFNKIVFPITHGIFYFCGFHPLQTFKVHNAGTMKRDRIEAELKRLDDYINNIDNTPEIPFVSLEQAADSTGVGICAPEQSTSMICIANKVIKSWAKNDADTYRNLTSLDFKMIIPAYGVDVTGFDKVWEIRQSMGEAPLNPHTLDSHAFISHREVKCFAHVISRETGQRIQLSECTFRFDEQSFRKVVEYRQENLFMAPTPP